MKKILLFLLISLSLVSPTFAEGEGSGSKCIYVATITGDRVNLRSGPHTNYDIISKLQEGDKVFVVKEQDQWTQIILPENTHLWVYDKLINTDNKVIKDSVNIRAKASIKSSIVCQIYRDTTIEPLGRQFEWIKIKAPQNALGWLNSKYLEKYLSYSDYIKEQEQIKREKMFEDAEYRYQKEMSKTEVDYDKIIEPYKNIINIYPDTIEGNESKKRYELLIEKKATDEMSKLEIDWQEKSSTKGKDLSEFVPKYTSFLEKYPSSQIAILAKERLNFIEKQGTIISSKNFIKTDLKDRASMVGVVHELGVLFNRPATHKLMQGKKIVCLLRSNKINLNDYVYAKTKIEGVLVQEKNWDIPIFEVEKIKKLSWKGRMRS